MLPEEDLEEGGLRMLEVDNRVILPELTHVRFVVTSADVIHSHDKIDYIGNGAESPLDTSP
jgi:cytochrome c oxidase subunit 2